MVRLLRRRRIVLLGIRRVGSGERGVRRRATLRNRGLSLGCWNLEFVVFLGLESLDYRLDLDF